MHCIELAWTATSLVQQQSLTMLEKESSLCFIKSYKSGSSLEVMQMATGTYLA
jgi:hypothetical protein